MRNNEYKNILTHESAHFFYQANNRYFLRLVERYIQPSTGKNILEAGCGTGYLGLMLSKKYRVTAVDANKTAVTIAQGRGIEAQEASVNELPHNDNSFEGIVCIDVLYHQNVIPQLAVAEFWRVLKPSGYLILRVAAHEWLRTSHDLEVQTKHRFEKGEVKRLLEEAGFTIIMNRYMNSFLLVPLYLKKVIGSRTSQSHISSLNPLLNRVLAAIAYVEHLVGERVSMPDGIGILAVAQKPFPKNKRVKQK